ncbi:hypothetical protein [Actinomadura sp. NPDC049753]|uniref:hypothetical protein n=1 Tax=Actinomadura sp. NPDC049753 TaxID=3154739 RepID=UPI00344821E3
MGAAMAEEWATVLAVYEGIQTAYKAYQSIKSVYDGFSDLNELINPTHPTHEELVIQKLDQLHTDFQVIQYRLDAVAEAIRKLLDQQQQAYLLQTRQQLEQLKGLSRTAADQASAWVAGDRTDALLRAQADDNSRVAANSILEGNSFFLRPVPGGETFDHRIAIPVYLYVLTVRLGVMITITRPVRFNKLAREEIRRHADRLGWIIENADRAIAPDVYGRPESDPGLFMVQYKCVDNISGYTTDLTREDHLIGGQADLDDYKARLDESLRLEVRHRTGVVLLLSMRDVLEYWAADPMVARFTPWSVAVPAATLGTPPEWRPFRAIAPSSSSVKVLWPARDGSIGSATLNAAQSPVAWTVDPPVAPAGTMDGGGLPACVPAPGQASVFIQDPERRLAELRMDPAQPSGWSAPVPVVTQPEAPPQYFHRDHLSVTVMAPGEIALFWRYPGHPGAIHWRRRGADGTWGEPQQVTPDAPYGNALISVSPAPEAAWVFYTARDESIWSTHHDPREQSGWAPPVQLAPPGTYRVAAVCPRPWQVLVFWTGPNRAVYGRHLDAQQAGQAWSEPFQVAPPRSTGYLATPSAICPAEGEIRLFWDAADGHIRTTHHDPQRPYDQGWAPWYPVGSPLFGSRDPVSGSYSLVVTGRGAGTVSLFRLDAQRAIQAAQFDPNVADPGSWYDKMRSLTTSAGQLAAQHRPADAASAAHAGIEALLEGAPVLEGTRDDLAYDLILQIAFNSGYLPAGDAVEPVRQAAAIAERLTARHPENLDYAYRHPWMLIVLAQRLDAAGRRPEAAAPAHQAIHRMLATAPALQGTRDDLTYDLILQIAFNSGYLAPDEGVRAVQDTVAIAERLAARHPESLDYAYRHPWMLIVLGQRLDAAGRRPEATEPTRQAITALLRLAPTLEGTRDDLTYDLILQIAFNSGYLPPGDAVQPVQRAVAIAEQLASRHPDNLDYAYRHPWMRVVLAQRLDAAGRRPEAAEPTRQAFKDMLRLAASLEGTRDDLTYDLILQIAFNSGYLPAGDAVEPVRQAVAIAERLATRHPENLDYAYRHPWMLVVLAQRLDAAGRRPEAAEPARQAFKDMLRLAASLEGTRDDLTYDLVLQIAFNSGYLPPGDAVAPVSQSVAIAERLTARHPENLDYAYRHPWMLVVLAQRLDAAGQRPEATEPTRQAITALLRLAPSFESMRDDLVLDLIAQVGTVSGYLPPNEALPVLQETAAIAERAAARHPDDASYRDRLAWIREVLAQHQPPTT